MLVLPEGGETAPPSGSAQRPSAAALLLYLGAAAMVAAATGVGWLLQSLLDLSNVALIFVVPVLAAALAWGLGPGLAAAVLAVLGYNFFFLDPLYTFHISDPESGGGPAPVLGRGRARQQHRVAHPLADPGGTPGGGTRAPPSTPSPRSSPASPESTTSSGPRPIRSR